MKFRSFEYKLYLNQSQATSLEEWLSVCCWLYNQSLEMRIKAYRRRGQSVSYAMQQSLLTEQRGRVDRLRRVPVEFERDALRRLDRGFKRFFNRNKSGNVKQGFPRFRPRQRYTSLEQLVAKTFVKGGRICIVGIGWVRCRGRQLPEGKQYGLRIVRRHSGWYAQVLMQLPPDQGLLQAEKPAVGIDVGLKNFFTTSDGEVVGNPKWGQRSAVKIRSLQRKLSRRQKGSRRRRTALAELARHSDRLSSQRKGFCHQQSTALVRKYGYIAVENLNVAGMVRSRFGKSIFDAAWSTFLGQLAYKAEEAGCQLVRVNARGTSQECPKCGKIKPKKIVERVHRCDCGCEMDRDHAAAQVILARGLVATGSTRAWRSPSTVTTAGPWRQGGPTNRVSEAMRDTRISPLLPLLSQGTN